MIIEKLPIFTHEIFHFQLPNFDSWKKIIEQIILVEENKKIHGQSTVPDDQCNVVGKRTAWNSHIRYPTLNSLCKEIKNHISEFIKNEGYDIPRLDVENCWINWYKKNEHAQPHKHGNYLSVVLFVDIEDTDGKFFFHDDCNLVFIKKEDVTSNFSNLKELKAKNGTVIFFDGSLHHSVSANTTDKTRVTMAVNFYVNYEIKLNEH